MRLWSLHPKYLDRQGLVALWREGLLAKKVLEGKTKGYTKHPQLTRFKLSKNPLESIDSYLHAVCDEADRRGYAFNRTKLGKNNPSCPIILVTNGQVTFEWNHLLKKLFKRSRKLYFDTKNKNSRLAHPLFKKVKGPLESWEVV